MNNSNHSGWPLAYFLTWTAYGTWLHGDERGSVDRVHNKPGQPVLSADARRLRAAADHRVEEAYSLDAPRRRVVVNAIREVCSFRKWPLHAVHVRSTHVHAIVTAAFKPEKIMNDLKATPAGGLTKPVLIPKSGNDGPGMAA